MIHTDSSEQHAAMPALSIAWRHRRRLQLHSNAIYTAKFASGTAQPVPAIPRDCITDRHERYTWRHRVLLHMKVTLTANLLPAAPIHAPAHTFTRHSQTMAAFGNSWLHPWQHHRYSSYTDSFTGNADSHSSNTHTHTLTQPHTNKHTHTNQHIRFHSYGRLRTNTHKYTQTHIASTHAHALEPACARANARMRTRAGTRERAQACQRASVQACRQIGMPAGMPPARPPARQPHTHRAEHTRRTNSACNVLTPATHRTAQTAAHARTKPHRLQAKACARWQARTPANTFAHASKQLRTHSCGHANAHNSADIHACSRQHPHPQSCQHQCQGAFPIPISIPAARSHSHTHTEPPCPWCRSLRTALSQLQGQRHQLKWHRKQVHRQPNHLQWQRRQLQQQLRRLQ